MKKRIIYLGMALIIALVTFGHVGDAGPVRATSDVIRTYQQTFRSTYSQSTLGVFVNTDAADVVAVPGDLQYTWSNTSSVPGSGKSYIWTLYVNGTATALKVTQANTSLGESDQSDVVHVSAGDSVYWKYTSSGSPTAPTGSLTYNFVPDTAGWQNWGSSHAYTYTNTSTYYMALGGVSNGSSESTTDSSYFNSICPAAGTLQYMYAISGHAPGAGNSVTATIYKNGSATALTLTISGSGKAANDTSDSVSVAAGDELKLVITDSNPSYNGDFLNVDVGFQASDSGMGIVYGDENINWNPNQGYLHSGDQVISMFNIDALADTLMKFAVLRQTIGNVELKCIGAPGTGNSITATLWADGNATNVSVTVSGSNTVATDTTDTAYFDDNHLLEWKMSWTGTPATTKFGVAFTQDCR